MESEAICLMCMSQHCGYTFLEQQVAKTGEEYQLSACISQKEEIRFRVINDDGFPVHA